MHAQTISYAEEFPLKNQELESCLLSDTVNLDTKRDNSNPAPKILIRYQTNFGYFLPC